MIRGGLKETIIGWFNSWNTGQQLNSSFWKILNGIESKMAQYFPRGVSCRTLCPRSAFWRERLLGQISFRNCYILKLSNHVLEKILESPLDSKEIKPVNPKGNQPWIFIGNTDGKAEASILWPPDVKSWFIGKDPDAGTDWGRRRDNRGWESWMASPTQWTWVWANPGDSEGHGSLACCSPRGCKESDTI